MDRRLLAWTALAAALLVLAGVAGVDRPLAEWVRASGIENAPVFVVGLAALDTAGGIPIWFWLAGCAALALGALGSAMRRDARWPRALVAAGIVQVATLHTMNIGKELFGRVRPQQLFESGDWSHAWHAGGTSFPSGHSAFYFGLLLPLAAACPRAWQRVLLVAIAVFAILARIDMAKHFLSDVSASALIAALYSLLVATALRRWLPAPPARIANEPSPGQR
ncbi:MAG TPA: phosphatase PAP2 family protein [Dokdonella sp.]|nr:phosphatase PAP2 family protein [Dokdonella sp.]